MKKIRKNLIVAALAAAMLLSSTAVNVSALSYGEEWASYYKEAPVVYTDVDEDYWAYDAIMRTSDKNWFSGYPDGSFRPEESITRAEALKVFVVFLGLEVTEIEESSFPDIDPNDKDQWYAPYIEAGKDLFPTHTTIQGKRPFNPNMPVTREDTVYALVKALGCDVGTKIVDQSLLNMFNDKSSISGDLRSTFVIALNHELVSGYPDGTIRAQDPLTRAEFATLLLRGTDHGFHDKYEYKVSGVKLYPSTNISLSIGETETLTARATYTDGSNKPFAIDPYLESGNGVISLIDGNIVALKEGTAVIKFNDTELKKKSVTVTVTKPTGAPTLKITDYPEETEEATATIRGKITDTSGKALSLICGTRDVAVSADGTFTAKVSLKEGENEIPLTASNAYDVETTRTIVITRLKKETAPEKEPETTDKTDKTDKADKTDKTDKTESEDRSDLSSESEDPLSYLKFDKTSGTVTDCGLSVESLSIPKKLQGINVYHIGEEAFADCEYLHTITLPTTLKSIEAHGFSGCKKLTSIDVPSGVKTVGTYAFENCLKLTDVSLPSTLKKLSTGVFSGCKRLKNVTFDGGITTIGEKAFSGCKSLEELELPDTVTTISKNAFEDCGSLEKLILPKSVEKIDEEAFTGCNALTIYSTVNSYAIEYAEEHGIAWKIL